MTPIIECTLPWRSASGTGYLPTSQKAVLYANKHGKIKISTLTVWVPISSARKTKLYPSSSPFLFSVLPIFSVLPFLGKIVPIKLIQSVCIHYSHEETCFINHWSVVMNKFLHH